MWSTVQRVPSQTQSGSDSGGRTVVPETPSQEDMESPERRSAPQMGAVANGDIGLHSTSGGAGQSSHQPHQPNGIGHGGADNDGRGADGGGGSDGFPTQNGRGGEDGEGNSSDSPAESELEHEELPQVEVQMVPLSTAIGRIITFAYTELVTLVDTLASRSETDRRSEILKYTEHMSDLLTKLLVLVRWAKHAPQIQKCQNVIAYLDSQNRYFEYAVDSIYATFLSMPGVRMRNYDVGNAVDILTTGSYQRLPAAISRAVPPPKLTRRQIRDTLNAIDAIIRGRILKGEPLPSAMRRYRIANGRIVFTVPKEFEATLTLLQCEKDIPWHVVNIKVLVAGDASLSEEQQITINTWQIIDRAQHILIEASNAAAAAETTAAAEAKDVPASDQDTKQSEVDSTPQQQIVQAPPPQLAQLYDFIHQQCFTVLLETVLKQSTVLRRARWENLLQVEMSADRTMLAVRYWTSNRAAASATLLQPGKPNAQSNAIVFRICPLPVPRPIHASAVSTQTDSGTEEVEFRRIEHDRRCLIPKVGLSITWTAHSGLSTSRVWTRTVSHAHELSVAESTGFELELDSEAVDTERLLRQATWQHSRAILESLHKAMLDSQLFSSSAVELLFVSTTGSVAKTEPGAEEMRLGTSVPVLRAWYRHGEGAVDILVDAFTGRLVARASETAASGTALSEAMIGQLADQLNRTPWRIAQLLVNMRSSLALADLDCLVFRSLGLRPQSSQGLRGAMLPGFALSGVTQRTDPLAQNINSVRAAAGTSAGMASPALSGVPGSQRQQQQQQQQQVSVSTNFPLRISQQEADALVRDVAAGVENPLSRMRFYMIEGTEGIEDQAGGTGGAGGRGEWYVMVAMADRLRFRLVLLSPHPTDRLLFTVSQVIALQVDRLFSSVARRLLGEQRLRRSAFDTRDAAPSSSNVESTAVDHDTAEREITERVDAMLTGRTSITLDYLNALASSCRARLALRLLQTQLTRWKIPYSFRLPSFSTSPHGHRAAVSQELSVVGLDRMGLYELDEQVPLLYIPVSALMRASPINWNVADQGVLPDEARRMVSIRVASDELDPSLRADLSSSTRVDQHRQAAIAEMEGRARPLVSRASHASYATMSNSVALGAAAAAAAGGSVRGAGHSLIGRHVIPCQVIASIPLALDGLPSPVASAYADAVHFGAHAAADGGYHRDDHDGPHKSSSGSGGSGYSKIVLVYKQVNRALQCLIRDWSEQHLMTHIARHLSVWEQRAFRRVMVSTSAFYPFSAGPYTGAVANMLGSWRGLQSAELVVQCIGSCFVSISCRVPYPFANEDMDKSMYPPGYGDSGGSDLSFHLTLADVDYKTNRITRIASTWPWVFSHTNKPGQQEANDVSQPTRNMSFELSTSLSRWLRTLQAQLNLTGNPLTTLSMIVQLMPIHDILDSMATDGTIRPLLPTPQVDAPDSLIRFRLKRLLDGDKTLSGSDNATTEGDDIRGTAMIEDHSDMTLRKLSAAHKNASRAFERVRGLHIMHMYTAVDNIRLVFNSRYVVDMRFVSSETFYISDAVRSADLSRKQQTVGGNYRGTPTESAPLVTAATEPIPLFADWLEAMSREMTLDWEKFERGISALFRDVAPQKGDNALQAEQNVDAQEKLRQFQHSLFHLRKDASMAERIIYKFRPMAARQCPSFLPVLLTLPPSAMLCTGLHLVPVLRSLMQWLVRSVHVRDQLDMAISRTQEIIGNNDRLNLMSVKEKLVFMNDTKDAATKQVMIVAFTGARESVRCEFLITASVSGNRAAKDGDQAEKDKEKEQQHCQPPPERSSSDMDVDASQQTAPTGGGEDADHDMDVKMVQSVVHDTFKIPEDLMHVDLDLRIVPLIRPPNGITDAAATFLIDAFKLQPDNIRQRAGTLVRLLALPPQVVMDVVDIARKLEGKAAVGALEKGNEHYIRLDSENYHATFALRICGGDDKWAHLAVRYELLTGLATVVFAMDPDDDYPVDEDDLLRLESPKLLNPWTVLMDGVLKSLEQQTAFTRDMGKNGKSRLFDIVKRLQDAYQRQQQQSQQPQMEV
ncbi:mediator complex subunit [Coemansia guatemalensis]|uniref:Mediator of RNA polymerase II transcription subunit 14 n=1 Tax=Coemansia guatemalensis TaxID=2761395 RepID=A0A9W8I6J8_9FUNG|nr:mediator complex subunit [Coemansia guatemalensis]